MSPNTCPMCGHDERRWSEAEILALWAANPDPVAFARALHLPVVRPEAATVSHDPV